MLLKDQIHRDIDSLNDPQILNQVFEYLQVVKQTAAQLKPNRDAVLQFAGILTDSEAGRLRKTIQQEFNQIEGEW